MNPACRRILGLVAVLLAAQGFGACKAGMRPGASGEPAAQAVAGASGEAPAAAPEGGAENPCVSSKCHATILAQKNVHDPAEGCTDCHEAASPTHPVKGEKTFALLNDVPGLCYTCHDEYGKKKTVHSPAGDGECLECHDPHSTAEAGLLKKPMGEVCAECHEGLTEGKVVHGPVSDGDCTSCHNPHETDTEALLLGTQPGLCTDCHTEVAEAVANAKVSHGGLDTDEGCLGCHTPHSSDTAALMKKPVREVCMECHDEVPAKATVQHGKDNSGNCANCHTPHGGDLEVLLVAEFPSGQYVPWTDKAYPLCFECHDRKMVTEQESGSATEFRDGKKNLHYAHVNIEEKGRSCRFCHAWHGGDQPKLVQESVPFGKWNFRMKFVKTENGGSCAPACHKIEYYDREDPGRRPSRTRGGFDKGA